MGADGGVKIVPLDGKLRVEIDGKALHRVLLQRRAARVFLSRHRAGRRAHDAQLADAEPGGRGARPPAPPFAVVLPRFGQRRGFLGETPKSGKILHERFLETTSGAEQGHDPLERRWVAPDGSVPCTDERTFRVYPPPRERRMFDFEVTLRRGSAKSFFGDTKEGSMAIRLNESMKLIKAGKKPGDGHLSTARARRTASCVTPRGHRFLAGILRVRSAILADRDVALVEEEARSGR